MEEKTSRNAASSGAVRTPFLALPGAPLQRLELSAWKMRASQVVASQMTWDPFLVIQMGDTVGPLPHIPVSSSLWLPRHSAGRDPKRLVEGSFTPETEESCSNL